MALPVKTHFSRVGGNQWADSFYRPYFPVGDVRYVHSSGTATGPGFTPETAYSTLQAAHDASAANNGDEIHILPGHAESLTGAAAIAISKAGLKIIGLGQGRLAPVFTYTTAVGASFDISAANTYLKNLVFVVGFDNITAMVNVSAADVFFDGCEFETNNGTMGVAIGILTAATATRFRVENCFFHGPAVNTGTTTTAQIKHEVGIDYIIRNNAFIGGKCTQNILNATTILGGLIEANKFVTYTGTKGIAVAAASTPFIVNNRFNVPSGTAPIVAAAGFVIGNLYSAAAGVTAPTAATF